MGSNLSPEDVPLLELFHTSRISGGAEHTFLLLLYSPLGVILSVIRLFMLFHIYILSCILPLHLPVLRMAIRVMLLLCGLVVTVQGEEDRRDTCPLVVSNYISPVDRLIFSLIQPNIMVDEWNLPPFVCWFLGLKDLNIQERQTFIQKVNGLCQETRVPLYTRPEGLPTSGEKALLKFSTWQFSVSESVQPVILTARRPMPIAMTTMNSNALSDIFWFMFTPYTLFTVRYLPVVMKREDESAEEFSEKTRENMAAALNVSCSKFTRHDSREMVKRMVAERKTACDGTVNRPASQPLPPRLEAMVQYCKEVVPQVPLDVLRAEILRTEDSEATLSSIFEGNLRYEPEANPAPQSLTSQPPASSQTSTNVRLTSTSSTSGAGQTYAAKEFAKQSNQREMSLAERKSAMLTEARLRYINKHGLSITLEQIESRQF